jgi:hypothetical protein
MSVLTVAQQYILVTVALMWSEAIVTQYCVPINGPWFLPLGNNSPGHEGGLLLRKTRKTDRQTCMDGPLRRSHPKIY